MLKTAIWRMEDTFLDNKIDIIYVKFKMGFRISAFIQIFLNG